MGLRFGIVGTGMIAGAMAEAISSSTQAELTAVASRDPHRARAFIGDRPGVSAAGSVHELVARDDVDAVYVATPTTTKEVIARSAINAGRHVLVDKPFANWASVNRIARDAAGHGVAFMDATHFVHHPRTDMLRRAITSVIGQPRSLHTAFFFPLSDERNIRFNPDLEPTGALGDMAWYCMRAVVEYLVPRGRLLAVAASAERSDRNGAVRRVSGLLAFETGVTATFDAGFTVGASAMEFILLGSEGMVTMDDFVLDRGTSFPREDRTSPTGYTVRTGVQTRSQFKFVETPSEYPAMVRMIDAFAALADGSPPDHTAGHLRATHQTQRYLDAVWGAVARGQSASASGRSAASADDSQSTT
jgi:predicted dehydrogenase